MRVAAKSETRQGTCQSDGNHCAEAGQGTVAGIGTGQQGREDFRENVGFLIHFVHRPQEDSPPVPRYSLAVKLERICQVSSVALQAGQQSNQRQASRKSELPDMFLDGGHAWIPHALFHADNLAGAREPVPRAPEKVFSLCGSEREHFLCQGAMALAAFSIAPFGMA